MSRVFSVIWQGSCFDTSSCSPKACFVSHPCPRADSRSATSGYIWLCIYFYFFLRVLLRYVGPPELVMVYVTYICLTIIWPANPKDVTPNMSRRGIFMHFNPDPPPPATTHQITPKQLFCANFFHLKPKGDGSHASFPAFDLRLAVY